MLDLRVEVTRGVAAARMIWPFDSPEFGGWGGRLSGIEAVLDAARATPLDHTAAAAARALRATICQARDLAAGQARARDSSDEYRRYMAGDAAALDRIAARLLEALRAAGGR